MVDILASLGSPERIYSRKEIVNDPKLVTKKSGIYAWYFKDITREIPVGRCNTHQGLTMLYVGICPRRPNKSGKISKKTLYDRINQHYKGNARSSTLRKTLGCLLEERLGIEFYAGSDGKLKFTKCSEEALSNWMDENAFVTWKKCEGPWKYEKKAFSEFFLPLNLQGNKQNNEFYSTLKEIRKKALEKARAMI